MTGLLFYFHVVRSALGRDVGGVTWGLFRRKGSISDKGDSVGWPPRDDIDMRPAMLDLQCLRRALSVFVAAGTVACAGDPEPGEPRDTAPPTPATPPAAPALTSVSPTSPSSERMPTVAGTGSPEATAIVFGAPACVGELGRGPVDPQGAFAIDVSVAPDQETVFSARLLRDGLESPCSEQTVAYVHDGTPPEAPVITTADPPSPARTTMPTLTGTAEAGSEVHLFVTADCGGEPLLTVSATDAGAFSATPVFEAGTVTSVRAQAVDAAGNRSACGAPFLFEVLSETSDPSIRFPPGRSLTDQEAITVRGVVEDPTPIAGITVAGVPATSDDGFATWSATVPLALGANRVDIDVERATGAVLEDVVGVDVQREATLLREVGPLAYDGAQGRVLTVERLGDRVIAVDVATGEASVVSSATVGSGEPLLGPQGIAIDAAGDRAWVTENAGRVMEIDLATGDRTVLSGGLVGGGDVDLGRPLGIIHDAVRNRVVVTDTSLDTVIAIDLGTGDRTELTGGTATLSEPEGMAIDGNRAFLVDSREDSVVEVDLLTGARTVISDDDTGTGTTLTDPVAISVVGAGATATLIVADAIRGSLFEVDPDTGDRTRPRMDLRPELGAPSGLATRSDPDTVYVANRAPGWIVEVDRAGAGARTPLPTPGLPARPSVGEAADVVGDLAGGRFFVSDLAGRRVIEVTLATGARRVVASDGADLFSVPQGLAYDGAGDRVHVAGSNRDVIEVDLTTDTVRELGSVGGSVSGPHLGIAWDGGGNQVLFPNRGPSSILAFDGTTGDPTTLSGDGTGVGPDLRAPSGVALDASASRLFVVDQIEDRLVEVDLLTGDRTIVSDEEVGQGPDLFALSGVAWDPAQGRVMLTTGTTQDALVSVDPATGDRAIIADRSVGSGPRIDGSTGIDVLGDGVLLVAARLRGGVYAVDATTGDTVFVAR